MREHGTVFYASLQNNYSVGILVADSMGKEVTPYALDGFDKDAYDYAVKLIQAVSPNLERLDSI